jgi:hypothetical protein
MSTKSKLRNQDDRPKGSQYNMNGDKQQTNLEALIKPENLP